MAEVTYLDCRDSYPATMPVGGLLRKQVDDHFEGVLIVDDTLMEDTGALKPLIEQLSSTAGSLTQLRWYSMFPSKLDTFAAKCLAFLWAAPSVPYEAPTLADLLRDFSSWPTSLDVDGPWFIGSPDAQFGAEINRINGRCSRSALALLRGSCRVVFGSLDKWEALELYWPKEWREISAKMANIR